MFAMFADVDGRDEPGHDGAYRFSYFAASPKKKLARPAYRWSAFTVEGVVYKAGPVGFLIVALAFASTAYRLFVHGEVTPTEKAACPCGKVIIGFDGKKVYCFTFKGIAEVRK